MRPPPPAQINQSCGLRWCNVSFCCCTCCCLEHQTGTAETEIPTKKHRVIRVHLRFATFAAGTKQRVPLKNNKAITAASTTAVSATAVWGGGINEGCRVVPCWSCSQRDVNMHLKNVSCPNVLCHERARSATNRACCKSVCKSDTYTKKQYDHGTYIV